MELKYLTIRDRQYPACFSLRVAMDVADKFGSVEALFEQGKSTKEAIEQKVWLIEQMLLAGQSLAALEGKQTETPPAAEELMASIGIADMGVMINSVITASQKVTVELQPDPKNAAATQEL